MGDYFGCFFSIINYCFMSKIGCGLNNKAVREHFEQLSLNPSEVDKLLGVWTSYRGYLDEFIVDKAKAYKGNKAAIRRCRVKLLEIEKLCKAARAELTSVRVNLHLTK